MKKLQRFVAACGLVLLLANTLIPNITVFNLSQSPTAMATADSDGDGVRDLEDNCPSTLNADQSDGG